MSSITRRSFSFILKVKGSKTNPKFSHQEYLGSQAQIAVENNEDVREVMEREVIYYGDKIIKVQDLKRHIIKSALDYLKSGGIEDNGT